MYQSLFCTRRQNYSLYGAESMCPTLNSVEVENMTSIFDILKKKNTVEKKEMMVTGILLNFLLSYTVPSIVCISKVNDATVFS